MNETGPVEFAAATGNVHTAFDLQGLTTGNFVVQKLIRMRVRGGAADAAGNLDFDADRSSRRAIALDVCHHKIRAVFGSGRTDIVVGEVSAVLKKHVARESMHLV